MADTSKNPDLTDVRKDLDELRADLAALGKDVKELVKVGASRGSESLQHTAESALASVTEQGREAVLSVENCVKNRPVESLLVAFGAGVLLGNIIRR